MDANELQTNGYEEDYTTITDPNILWTAKSYHIHEGMSLVTIRAQADEVEINDEYLRSLEQEQNIRHARFFDERTNNHTIVLHQPWEAEITYSNMLSASSNMLRASLQKTQLTGWYKCIKWVNRRRRCDWTQLNDSCTSDGSCTERFDKLCRCRLSTSCRVCRNVYFVKCYRCN